VYKHGHNGTRLPLGKRSEIRSVWESWLVLVRVVVGSTPLAAKRSAASD
jgi:hypothetical protein